MYSQLCVSNHFTGRGNSFAGSWNPPLKKMIFLPKWLVQSKKISKIIDLNVFMIVDSKAT